MPRVSRKSLNSNYFHVIVQGIEKKYIFNTYKYKKKYKELLIKNMERSGIELLAYCIMDNHAHMLIYCSEIKNMSLFMQRVNTSFALYYNKLNNRTGYLFKDRFHSIPIKSEKQLYRTLIYIHLNPVNAKICRNPELYYFSSYTEYLGFKGIVTEKVLKRIGFNRDNYKNMFKFIHYFLVKGYEFDDISKKRLDIEKISEYISENKIIDIVFQAEKIKQMIEDLKKEKISFTRIAEFLEISNKKLKTIIEEE